MPGRKFPLVTKYFYHVYNRGVEQRVTFKSKKDYQRFYELMKYYRFSNTNMSFSKFKQISRKRRREILAELEKLNKKFVNVIAYCLMPNHFHLLLHQITTNGITNYLRKIQNAYTKYFNKKNERIGSLYQGTFKSVLIESEEQLLHVFRYILLNPYSGAVIKDVKDLIDYPWTSIKEHLLDEKGICSDEIIKQSFKNNDSLKEFIYDRAEYQRNLENIKHLVLEKQILEGCVPAQP